VPELEAILLLRAEPGRRWTATEAGARLYVSVTMAAHVLTVLAERGFLFVDGDTYRYAPVRLELDGTVADLAHAYATDLIAITHLIHSKPATSIRQFADAFRLRKET
jgi:hypothetical protein